MKMKNTWKGVVHAKKIDDNDLVMVYCKGGVHRSVVMACCILISQGCSTDEVMIRINKRRPVANLDIKYFRSSILKFEEEWSPQHGR